MPSSPTGINWATLRRLRQKFLSGTAGTSDYWESFDDLEQYDLTLAQRIGWKWDFVLGDLKESGWHPPTGNIVDWGCGSGVAGRAFLDRFGHDSNTRLWLSDRSSRAMQFAARRAGNKFPDLPVERGAPKSTDVLLISHVLTELDQAQIEKLVAQAATATAVVWVEPGTYEASLTLIAIREQMRERFNIVAPCTHQNRCGILTPENERHWCHFFAIPPQEIHTDAFWSQFALELEIDLRSLPLSYLVLDQRAGCEQSPLSTRILGRPNMFKAHAEVLGCSCRGVCSLEVVKRTHGNVYRQLKKGKGPSRVNAKSENGRVTEWLE